MNKLVAAILLTTLTIGPQAQTTTKKQKPQAVAPPAVSDAFAKTALHAPIAMRNSSGSTVTAGHIETLLEDLEIEASTPVEQLLLKYFELRNARHNRTLREYAILQYPAIAKNEIAALLIDKACFDAYIVLLKADDPKTDFGNDVPSDCNVPTVVNPSNTPMIMRPKESQ